MNNGFSSQIFAALAVVASGVAMYHSNTPQMEVLDAGVCAILAVAFAILHLADSTKLDDNDENWRKD